MLDTLLKIFDVGSDIYGTYKAAEFAKDQAWSVEDALDYWDKTNLDYYGPVRSRERRDGAIYDNLTPGFQNLLDLANAQMFGGRYQTSNGLIGPNSLSQSSTNEYRSRYGLPPVMHQPRGTVNTAQFNPAFTSLAGLPMAPQGPAPGGAGGSYGAAPGGGGMMGGVNPYRTGLSGTGFGRGIGGGSGINNLLNDLTMIGMRQPGMSQNWMPSWMRGQQQGTMGQLNRAEFLDEYGREIGSLIGSMTGVPGMGMLGDAAGQAYLNYVMNNYNFSSPAQPYMDPAMAELMAAVDPDFAARQNSSQGYVPGSGRAGSNMGYRNSIRGGRGSAVGGGWRTIYERQDEEDELPNEESKT